MELTPILRNKRCNRVDHILELLNEINLNIIEIPVIRLRDVMDILIVAFLIYKVINWIKDTRAWTLFKGIIILLLMLALAQLFQLHTILWILRNTISVGIIAIVIIFQPELRRALEQLGRGEMFFTIFGEDQREGREGLTANSVESIIKAVEQMGKTRTGALIVFEREVKLGEYERTGISIDANISSQLLLNIFYHNTPLHDGAVLIRNNMISAATCYLPLTDDLSVSKELGTRHRAAIGISEISDCLVLVVSEETGNISAAIGGNLIRNVNADYIRRQLTYVPKKKVENLKFVRWRGRHKDAE